MIRSAITALCIALATGTATVAHSAPSPYAALAAPQAISEIDRTAIRILVESQLEALAADDGERAFSFATPAIRNQFGDAATFIGMVKRGYPMLIRPAGVSFAAPERTVARAGVEMGEVVTQTVRFRGEDGVLFRAVYALERQADGSWRIGGCVVVRDRQSLST